MGIVLGSNFDVQTALPLDARTQVADITARNAIAALRRYEGLTVYVISEGKNYQLIGGILDANWTESGGAGIPLASAEAGIIAFAGGGQASATQLTCALNQVDNVATAGDSVKLPAAVAGMQVVVVNTDINALDIFPASGEEIDFLGTDAAFELDGDLGNVRLMCVTDGWWISAQGGGGGGGGVEVVRNMAVSDNVEVDDGVIMLDCTGGAVTATLPAASADLVGKKYYFKKLDNSANEATIAVTGADTIDGASSEVIPYQHGTRTIICLTVATWGIF